MNSIQKNIDLEKSNFNDLLDFIAFELSKTDNKNTKVAVDNILKNLHRKYYTKIEVEQKLQTLIEKFNQLNENLLYESQSLDDKLSSKEIMLSSYEREQMNDLKKSIDRLQRNGDLSNLIDPTLHFSDKHLGVASRIFNLQITQNYLSALKYFFLDELVSKQNIFNSATLEALDNLVNLITMIKKDNEIKLNELSNYKNASEGWIREHEFKLTELTNSKKDSDIKLAELTKSKKESQEWIKKIEIQLNENYNELQYILTQKDLKTNEYLLSKIAELEEKIKNLSKK